MNANAIFVNCPFDNKYKPMLRALIFIARFYNLQVNISSYNIDSKSNRLERIKEMMKASRYSIHDLSLLKSEKSNEYYRMNMPFELGLDYGLGIDGKVFLIFENEEFELKKALSDISGWDVRHHKNEPEIMMNEFRRWIVADDNISDDMKVHSGAQIWVKYNVFYGAYSDYLKDHNMKEDEISIKEFIHYVDSYLNKNVIG